MTFVNAQPFRAFRLHMASGREFEVRHPEMIEVMKSSVMVYKATGESGSDWESVSLMLTESVSHLDAPTR